MINIDEKQGQLKKILIIAILVLLLTIIIITAQTINNEEQTNNLETQTTETQENTNLQTNSKTNIETTNETNTPDTEATNETETTNLCENVNCTNLCENVNCSISTLVCPDNFTATYENSCISETETCTSCIPSCEGHETNQTYINETETTNETIGNETETPPGTGEVIETEIQLDIQLSYPSKITRGEIIEIKATITDSGAKAKKVIANWILPQNFEIISGSLMENCGNLDSGESCISAISIQTSYSTSLGKNEIKIIISYEK